MKNVENINEINQRLYKNIQNKNQIGTEPSEIELILKK